MNKMQVHFKYLHFVWYQQFVVVFFVLHTAVLEFGPAEEFCFTVVIFEYTQSYLGCGATLQSSCEPIDPWNPLREYDARTADALSQSNSSKFSATFVSQTGASSPKARSRTA